MRANSADTVPGRRFLERLPGRVILFLGIVWSVSGAFQTLELGLPELVAVAVRRGWFDPDMVAGSNRPKEARESAAAARCAATTAIPADADPVARRHSRQAAFHIGLSLGMAAEMHARLQPRQDLIEKEMEETRQRAAALAVPAPPLPSVNHYATALGDFATYLEQDPACTASSLMLKYGPDNGRLYRFGAVLGYSALACSYGICGSFAREIWYYGRLTDVPEPLWRAMADGSLNDVPVNDRAKLVIQRLNGILHAIGDRPLSGVAD